MTAAPEHAEGYLRRGPFVWLLFAVAAIGASVLLLRVGRGLTWFFDEWDWVQGRRTGALDDLLRNHNGHLIAVPILLYKLSWWAFGLRNYTAMRLLTVAFHVATCAALLVWLRRRVRDELALGAVVILLFLGTAWQDLLWPSQIQYLGSALGGVAAFVFLDRRNRVGDIGAAASLTFALASSGVGLPFAGAVGLVLVLRRSTWHRLWVVLVPLAFYGLWYLGYGQSQAKGDNVHLVPDYVERAGAAAAGALLGKGVEPGHVVLGLILAAVVVTLAVRRRITPELAGVLALPALFWVLTALSRAQQDEPGASRYLYPGALMLIMVLAQLVDNPTWPRTLRTRAIAAGAVAVVVVVSLVGNVDSLRDGGAQLRTVSDYVRAELRAVELARDSVAPDFRPDLSRMPQVSAGTYLRAVDDLGSPAYSVARVRQAPEAVRLAADDVLLRALGVRSTPAAPGGDCTGAPVAAAGKAGRDLRGGALDLVISAGAAPVDVSVRNLAAAYEAPPFVTVAPGRTRAVSLPAVAAGEWDVHLAAADGFTVCRVSS
jgi:hypothetical protein